MAEDINRSPSIHDDKEPTVTPKTIKDLTAYEREFIAAIATVSERHSLTGLEMVIGTRHVLSYMEFNLQRKHEEIWKSM